MMNVALDALRAIGGAVTRLRAAPRSSRDSGSRAVLVIAAISAFCTASVTYAASTASVDTRADTVTDHKNVLYVTRLSHRDREEDDKIIAHLEQRGMIVKLVDQNAPVSATKGEDLVIISSVVSARDMVGTPFRDVPVPLLTWESDLFDSLRFTGRKKGEDFGEVEKEHYVDIVNAPSLLERVRHFG
jgi:hypothetical protein